MTWHIETKDGNLVLTPEELLKNLFSSALKSQHDTEIVPLVEALLNYLYQNRMLIEISLAQMLTLAMTLGYYYHVLIKNNKVKFDES